MAPLIIPSVATQEHIVFRHYDQSAYSVVELLWEFFSFCIVDLRLGQIFLLVFDRICLNQTLYYVMNAVSLIDFKTVSTIFDQI